MNPLPTLCTAQHLRTAAALTLLLLANLPAAAGPGAHGPNGEHLDSPATARTTSALPRVDAQTETFELVAELRASELVVLIDRYATNEPVLAPGLTSRAARSRPWPPSAPSKATTPSPTPRC